MILDMLKEATKVWMVTVTSSLFINLYLSCWQTKMGYGSISHGCEPIRTGGPISYKDAILPIQESHCGDQTFLWLSYLHNGFLYIVKTSLNWIRTQDSSIPHTALHWQRYSTDTLIARFMGPAWGPPGPCRPHVGPMNLVIRAVWTHNRHPTSHSHR